MREPPTEQKELDDMADDYSFQEWIDRLAQARAEDDETDWDFELKYRRENA